MYRNRHSHAAHVRYPLYAKSAFGYEGYTLTRSGEQDSARVIDGHSEAASARGMHPLRRWVVEHDDSWLFIVSYVGLAVVLSIAFGLFWLCAVVAVHFGLECVRQAHHTRGRADIAARALWEIKLDIALILFALVIVVYFEFVMGAAGLGGLARMGAQAGARFAGWQRVIRGLLLTVDDAAQVGRAALPRRQTAGVNPAARKGSLGDRLSVGFGVVCLLLLVLAPPLLGTTYAPGCWKRSSRSCARWQGRGMAGGAHPTFVSAIVAGPSGGCRRGGSRRPRWGCRFAGGR
jgi:hypothetical protein